MSYLLVRKEPFFDEELEAVRKSLAGQGGKLNSKTYFHSQFQGYWGFGRDTLLSRYFDLVISEENEFYDTYLLFTYNEKLFRQLDAFEFDCEEDEECGITVYKEEDQIILGFHYYLDYLACYTYFGGEAIFELLARLFLDVKADINKGNWDALYAFHAAFWGPREGEFKSENAKILANIICIK